MKGEADSCPFRQTGPKIRGGESRSLYRKTMAFLSFLCASLQAWPRPCPDVVIHRFVHAILNEGEIQIYGDGQKLPDLPLPATSLTRSS
jgi:hypothetical protein